MGVREGGKGVREEGKGRKREGVGVREGHQREGRAVREGREAVSEEGWAQGKGIRERNLKRGA